MRNEKEKPAVILANAEVFDFLKEKVGERKTRTEAYCDLLDKAQAGFVSPFLRKLDYELRPGQCHVTVSDLAADWHWHRATVRSFLDTLESLGQLERTKLTKSMVITMPVQDPRTSDTSVVYGTHSFVRQLNKALSDWVIGKTDTAEIGATCGQLVSQALGTLSEQDNLLCPDNRMETSSSYMGESENAIRETALGCIAIAAILQAVRESKSDDGSPLMEFFCLDLEKDWTMFAETSQEFARLLLDPEGKEEDIALDPDRKFLKTLLKPFLAFAGRAQEAACRPGDSKPNV